VKQLSIIRTNCFLLAHREADGLPEWHETQADVFFVQSGSQRFLWEARCSMESTVAHEKRTAQFKAVSAKSSRPGDVVRIPARVPHQLVLDGAAIHVLCHQGERY